MSFFYDLNNKLNAIRELPSVTHGQLNERDMSRAAKGYEKYGKEGMEALAKAGREGKALDPVRDKYNKYDESVEEGLGDVVKQVGSAAKKLGGRALNTLGHGDDADMIRDLQKKMGVPQTGMKPGAEPNPKQIKEKMSPAKAKSFAALAEPKDKITFADKIAGAKKEVDEMLGDVAAEAMKSALGGGKKVVADEASQDNAFTAHKRPRIEKPAVGTITRGSKHDVEEIPGGRRVTRRVDPSGISVGADDDAPASGEKRGRGRPKGPEKAPERVTGGATKHKGGRKTNEGSDYGQAQQIYDDLADIRAAAKQAQRGGEFPQGFASRLESVLYAAMTLIKNQQAGGAQVSEEELDEKAVSKKQQRFMGMVHAAQKGEKPASKKVANVAKDMGKKDAEDFAATKHKGLPEKKKPEGKKDSGNDAPKKKKEKTQEAGGTDTPTASSGFSYGKGIYDSINRELEEMIAESMNMSMSMNNDTMNGGPSKTLTVTATDEDAVKLGALLKMAGVGSDESSCGCGQPGCGCAQQSMDEAYGDTDATENAPDYPTETETSADPFQYSGGINKPKSTGQTTVPVIASQDDRQQSYAEAEEDAIKRMMEMAGIKFTDEMLEEGWKDKLAAAGMAGAMALGSLGAGAAQAAPQQGLGTPTAATQQQTQDIWMPAYKRALSLSSATKSPELKQEIDKLQQFYLDQSGRIGLSGKLSKNMEPKAAQDQKQLDLKHKDSLEKLMQKYGVNEEQVMAEEDDLARMMEMAGIAEAKGKKPDFLDVDKDGNKKESFKKAVDDKEEEVKESIFDLTNQWRAYKG